MKNKGLSIFLIILLVLVILALISFMVALIRGEVSFDMEHYLLATEVYQEQDIKEINVNVASSDIIIKASNDDQVHVQVYGRKNDHYDIHLNNSILEVNKNRIELCFGFCFSKNAVVVSVPKSILKDYELESRSGNILFDKVNANIIRADATSGNIKINDANEAHLSVLSGNVSFASIKKANIETASGSIKGEMAEEITSSSKSGDFKIEAIMSQCDITTKSGNATISQIELLKNSTISALSGNITIERANDIYFETKTSSGNVKIEHNNRQSEIELKLSTTSGNIRVK